MLPHPKPTPAAGARPLRGPASLSHLSASLLTIPDATPSLPATSTQAVQVLQMWNQWALVRFPGSGEQRWVDLERTPHAPLASAVPSGSPAATEAPAQS